MCVLLWVGIRHTTLGSWLHSHPLMEWVVLTVAAGPPVHLPAACLLGVPATKTRDSSWLGLPQLWLCRHFHSKWDGKKKSLHLWFLFIPLPLCLAKNLVNFFQNNLISMFSKLVAQIFMKLNWKSKTPKILKLGSARWMWHLNH